MGRESVKKKAPREGAPVERERLGTVMVRDVPADVCAALTEWANGEGRRREAHVRKMLEAAARAWRSGRTFEEMFGR